MVLEKLIVDLFLRFPAQEWDVMAEWTVAAMVWKIYLRLQKHEAILGIYVKFHRGTPTLNNLLKAFFGRNYSQ